MKRFLRRLFYTAAGVSALLLLAMLVLWPVSYYRWTDVSYDIAGKDGYFTTYSVEWLNGRLWLEYESRFETVMPQPSLEQHTVLPSNTGYVDVWTYFMWNTYDGRRDWVGYWTSLGISWRHYTVPQILKGGTSSDAMLVVPFSYLALLFSILPALAFRSFRRRRKAARAGLCPKCGYDLRAHAAGAVCPECGAAVIKLVNSGTGERS